MPEGRHKIDNAMMRNGEIRRVKRRKEAEREAKEKREREKEEEMQRMLACRPKNRNYDLM